MRHCLNTFYPKPLPAQILWPKSSLPNRWMPYRFYRLENILSCYKLPFYPIEASAPYSTPQPFFKAGFRSAFPCSRIKTLIFSDRPKGAHANAVLPIPLPCYVESIFSPLLTLATFFFEPSSFTVIFLRALVIYKIYRELLYET